LEDADKSLKVKISETGVVLYEKHLAYP